MVSTSLFSANCVCSKIFLIRSLLEECHPLLKRVNLVDISPHLISSQNKSLYVAGGRSNENSCKELEQTDFLRQKEREW